MLLFEKLSPNCGTYFIYFLQAQLTVELKGQKKQTSSLTCTLVHLLSFVSLQPTAHVQGSAEESRSIGDAPMPHVPR